jgi:hypothetical protein
MARKVYDERDPELLNIFYALTTSYIKMRDFKSAAESQDKVTKIY